MTHRTIPLAGLITGAAAGTIAVVVSCCCPAPSTAEITNALSFGYDSFIDRYTILEADTMESIREIYTDLANYASFSSGELRASFRNLFRYGNQTLDENLEAELSTAMGNSMRLDIGNNLHWKQFQEGSDYTFGNDYVQLNAYMKFKRRIGQRLDLHFRNRFEFINYRKKTDFDYDYWYFDSGLELESGSYFDRLIRIGAAAGYREAPDTTVLSYRRAIADLEVQIVSGERIFHHISVTADRRDYRGSARSPYWGIFAYADVTAYDPGRRSYSLKVESEITIFDEPSTTFFDTHFIRAGLRMKQPIRSASSVNLEPRFAVMLCPDYEEERYWEASAVIGFDVLGTNDYWLTISYEPGYRNYVVVENELYSDFRLDRVTLMGSVTVPWNVTINTFVSHDPERHARRDDDFSITLVSMEITKRF